MERVEYDEFGLFHENAEEFGLPYDGPPTVRREFVDLPDGRKISALVWGTGDPEYVFLHGGAQNAHTWDTVAMAIDRPLVAIDLPGHGHSDGPNEATGGQIAPQSLAGDVAVAIRGSRPTAWRDRHVARRPHHDRPHRGCPRAGALAWCSSTSPPASTARSRR